MRIIHSAPCKGALQAPTHKIKMSAHKQIFQTDSPSRWTAFKWSMRIVAFLVVLALASVLVAAIKNSNPSLPKLTTPTAFKPLSKPDQPLDFKSKKKKKRKNEAVRKAPIQNQVRAGFYVNWDLESYFSLRNNITKMNMVIPEWLFMDTSSENIIPQIDQRAFALMDSSKAKILPLLTNNDGDDWHDSIINVIVQSPHKRTLFIGQLLSILRKYGFDGVCIDFEDLYHLKDNDQLVDFHRELYDSLHANHMLATQCVPPYNSDYKVSELHKFNDYIFVMAYDQHYPHTKPGPVSDGKWVEQVLDLFTNKIESDKFVLCLAGYGYDWLKGSTGVDVTYGEALTLAKDGDAKITFDDNGYNLHFDYTDDDNKPHQVWFTDAATTYNIMRTASGYGLAGVALWRLGSEDSRMWSYYDNDLSDEALKAHPTDLSQLINVSPGNDVDYIGEGEVLDIVSSPELGKITTEYDDKDLLISEETYVQLPTSYVIKKFGKAPAKTVYLTFDDGPDEKYTPEIISILKKENVPAAFFMLGQAIESNITLVRQMYKDGYEIGNHTFFHPNLAHVSLERAKLEISATRRLIEIVTGHSTVMFRPPYNADAEPQDLAEIIPVEESRRENYITIGESIDPQDWDVEHINADTIFNRIVAQQALGSVILLHDAGGNRNYTVQALPRIIKYFKDKGYRFGTIAQLLGRREEDLMPAVTNIQEKQFDRANFMVASIFSYGMWFLYGLFFVGIFLSIGRVVLMGFLASIQKRKSAFNIKKSHVQPLVSIIIPAYNESVTSVNTIASLLQSDYPDFEIIFVNDGSGDNTSQVVHQAYDGHPRVKIFDKPNGGKASALNLGIARSAGDFVVCIDADTHLKPDAVSRLMESFINEDIGAVAGNVKVGNEINFLTTWQSIEYTTSQNFDRRAFELLNCITVVPGAIGAFRKEAIRDAGGFTSDTLAEDCDLTIRILRSGYTVCTNNEAISMTEVPEKMNMFLRQRFRWCFGVMQSFWKHRDACFNSEYKALGWVALPNILTFQIVLPLFAPLADLLMLVAIIISLYGFLNPDVSVAGVNTGFGDMQKMGMYYLIFQLVDLAGAILAFSFEKENITKLWLLIPQRFTYRWLMYYILFKSVNKAVKGELQSWGVLKRSGNVKMAAG